MPKIGPTSPLSLPGSSKSPSSPAPSPKGSAKDFSKTRSAEIGGEPSSLQSKTPQSPTKSSKLPADFPPKILEQRRETAKESLARAQELGVDYISSGCLDEAFRLADLIGDEQLKTDVTNARSQLAEGFLEEADPSKLEWGAQKNPITTFTLNRNLELAEHNAKEANNTEVLAKIPEARARVTKYLETGES